MGVRADLADAIAQAVVTDWPGVQVYGHPEDVTQLPALVLVPDDDWAKPASFGAGGNHVIQWQFQLSIAGHRAAVESTIEMIESLRALVVEGIGTLGGKWSGISKPDTRSLAGAEALVSDMSIQLLTERQT